MTVSNIRAEIKKLIDEENDQTILAAIHTLLVKTTLDPVLKEKLTSRALKSEDDIKSGRVHTIDEVRKNTRIENLK